MRLRIIFFISFFGERVIHREGHKEPYTMLYWDGFSFCDVVGYETLN